MPLFTRSFLLAVGILAGLEIVVRPLMPHTVSGRFSYGFDHASGFEEHPGRLDFVRTGGRRFIPQTMAVPKPPAKYRVFVIGDSVPRGPTLEKAYPWQLQELLRAGGLQAEVFNLGVPGYGVRRVRIVLEHVLQYQPDLVILHVNDSNEYEDEREYRRSEDFKDWHPKHWLMKSFIFRRAYEVKTEAVFWKLLPPNLRLQTATTDADAEVAAMNDRAMVGEWQQRVRQYVVGDVAMVHDAHVKMMLISQVRYDPIHDAIKSGAVTDLVNGLAAPEVLTLDMGAALEAHDPHKIFQDTAHVNENGHHYIAEAIRGKLLEVGWLPPKGG